MVPARRPITMEGGGTDLVDLRHLSRVAAPDLRMGPMGDKDPWERSMEHRTYVFIDLGNVHDCLYKITSLAEAGELHICAYADLHYNGPGVNPPVNCRGVSVFKATSHHKNAADTKMIWDIARLCCSSKTLRILVVTKDNGFRYLQELSHAAGHELAFANDWPSLGALLWKASRSSRDARQLSEAAPLLTPLLSIPGHTQNVEGLLPG
jgi:hypothetical protein